MSPSSVSASSLSASCAECPALREDLAARSADVETAKEQVSARTLRVTQAHVWVAGLEASLGKFKDMLDHAASSGKEAWSVTSPPLRKVRHLQENDSIVMAQFRTERSYTVAVLVVQN